MGLFAFTVSSEHLLRVSALPEKVGPNISKDLYGGSSSPSCVSAPVGNMYNYCAGCGTTTPQPVGCMGHGQIVWQLCTNGYNNCQYPVWLSCGGLPY